MSWFLQCGKPSPSPNLVATGGHEILVPGASKWESYIVLRGANNGRHGVDLCLPPAFLAEIHLASPYSLTLISIFWFESISWPARCDVMIDVRKFLQVSTDILRGSSATVPCVPV